MQNIHLELSDQLYNMAKQRAAEAGFINVDEYLKDVITDDLSLDADNLQGLFTPERLALIDQANAQAQAGKFKTSGQVHEHFSKRFKP